MTDASAFGWQPCPAHTGKRCKACGGTSLTWVDEPCPGRCGFIAGHRSRRAECPAWTEVDGVAVPVRCGSDA